MKRFFKHLGFVVTISVGALTWAAEFTDHYTCKSDDDSFLLFFEGKETIHFSRGQGAEWAANLSDESELTLSYTWNQFETGASGEEIPDVMVFNHFTNEAFYAYTYIHSPFGIKLPENHLTATCTKIESSFSSN